MESYEIPWAPVMGNADHEGCASEFWLAYKLSNAKHCLFKCGPMGMGYGNYIISINENGKPVHTLFMMDTHHEDEIQQGSYDHFTQEQIEWYKWAVKGIERINGKTVPSSVFMHIPVPEYRDAWTSVLDFETRSIKPPYDNAPYCQVHETIGAPKFQNGFFEVCRELGSTKNMVCGHEHTNCFAINYRGITLNYAMKTGYGCYWEDETTGGMTLNIDSMGNTKTDYIYISPKQSSLEKVIDWYHNRYLPNKKQGYNMFEDY